MFLNAPFPLLTSDVTLGRQSESRQEGRPGRDGGVSRVIQTIRDAIATAASEYEVWMPRLRQYPY